MLKISIFNNKNTNKSSPKSVKWRWCWGNLGDAPPLTVISPNHHNNCFSLLASPSASAGIIARRAIAPNQLDSFPILGFCLMRCIYFFLFFDLFITLMKLVPDRQLLVEFLESFCWNLTCPWFVQSNAPIKIFFRKKKRPWPQPVGWWQLWHQGAARGSVAGGKSSDSGTRWWGMILGGEWRGGFGWMGSEWQRRKKRVKWIN